MIGLLEDAADAMDARTNRLAGHVRSHTPTVGDPFVVVLVDEVADLTAHAPDTATKKRAASALSRLLAKGRAPGFAVVAAVIDPRKDVIPFRDLFPTRIAMRLAEPEQTDLVLGDGARDRGADCSTIPRALPGVGYVHDDTSTDPAPVRVRFSHVTDDHITALVADHLAAQHGSARRRWPSWTGARHERLLRPRRPATARSAATRTRTGAGRS